MATVYTRYLLTSQKHFDNGVYLPITTEGNAVLTLASTEYPVKITISGQIQRIASTNTYGVEGSPSPPIQVCKSDGSQRYTILGTDWVLLGQGANGGITTLTHDGINWQHFNGVGLKGQSLYLTIGQYIRHNSQWTIKIYTQDYMTAGTIITKTQFDNLITYQASSGATAATQNSKITASVGNTYGKSTVAANSIINASWYDS